MNFISLIPGVFIVILIIVGAIVIVKVVSKVAGAAKSVASTISDVAELAKAVKDSGVTKADVYEQPPKSVSGVTGIILPAITRDFPEFDYDEAKARAEAVLTSYLQAVASKDKTLLTEGYDELKNKLENKIRDLLNKNQTEFFDNIKIHRTEINSYNKSKGRCIITFQTAVEYIHYLKDESGNKIAGDEQIREQSKYNIDMIYVQNRDEGDNNYQAGMGLNCPNCGAPLGMLGAKKCSYCGTPIVELNIKSWNFSDVKEMS
ncbi:MAG: zinc-ribbon domain-containing protein [Lachnospiraceae bacterium]|nr:zinc-ribbon domain-containing protein [Lachnospiraceae bacterium]